MQELAPRTLGQVPGESNRLGYQGRGTAVIIAPWNFPLAILGGMAVAALVAAADEISCNRPGARKEKVEEYIRRLRHIEDIATAHPGVRTAYALENGKEVRILVDSAAVDDAYADQLADEITDRLEEELDQIGQLKVCLIREVRAVHYAR